MNFFKLAIVVATLTGFAQITSAADLGSNLALNTEKLIAWINLWTCTSSTYHIIIRKILLLAYFNLTNKIHAHNFLLKLKTQSKKIMKSLT